jgi:SAM-dependent methyltransferase
MKLNIGSGNKIMKGYLNLDIVKLKHVDMVHDLNIYPYPFKDNTFEEVYADNVMEHLDDIIKPVEEIHRISKNNAIIKIIVPYTPSVWAFCDPTHKQFYTYFTFNYFTETDELNYYSHARFEINKITIRFEKYMKPIEWIFNSCKLFKKIHAIFLYFLIPAMFLEFELRVIKK